MCSVHEGREGAKRDLQGERVSKILVGRGMWWKGVHYDERKSVKISVAVVVLGGWGVSCGGEQFMVEQYSDLEERVLRPGTSDILTCVMCECGCRAAKGSYYVRSGDPIIV